ncbi:MAG: hypothetical protein ACRCSO_13330 [Sphingomonas sp.]
MEAFAEALGEIVCLLVPWAEQRWGIPGAWVVVIVGILMMVGLPLLIIALIA